MGLSIRGCAKRRGVSHKAVQKALASGRIERLADGTIGADAADQAWSATTAPRLPPLGAERPAGPSQATAAPASGVSVLDRGTYHRTRIAKLAIEAQRAQLELDRRRGTLIARDRATLVVFRFARVVRDSWLSWPTRAAPAIAAELGVEPAVLVVALDEAVRAHLEELAGERCEF